MIEQSRNKFLPFELIKKELIENKITENCFNRQITLSINDCKHDLNFNLR